MRISVILSIALASTVATKANAQHSFREIAARRVQVVPNWPVAYIISFNDWCLTAKRNSVIRNGDHVGLIKCDFLNNRGFRSRQLFLLDDVGKIRSALDPNKCMYVQTPRNGQIQAGHSRLKFIDCNARVPHILFTHNRVFDELRTVGNPSYCIKQTGNSPNRQDTLRAYDCIANQNDPGIVFEYREFDCSIGGDVECCDDVDCGRNACCIDYACQQVDPNTNNCVPQSPALCNQNDLECCDTSFDCPTNGNYTCISNMCLGVPRYLSVTIDGKNWCASKREGEFGEHIIADSEECRPISENPLNQLWSRDPYDRLHSEANILECLYAGSTGVRDDGRLYVATAPCELNQFILADNKVFLAQDSDRCLTSTPSLLLPPREMTASICATDEDFDLSEQAP